MDRFDERYEIRRAYKCDTDNIMEFIGLYWKKDHIMSLDKNLFNYEYGNEGPEEEYINFILAVDRKTNLIEAIFGFIKSSNTEEYEKKHIWGSMWKVNELNDNIPLLGVELAKRVTSIVNCSMHIGNGANPKTTVPLRKLFFKDKCGKMKHHYLLNESTEEYKIAVIKNKTLNINPKHKGSEEVMVKVMESIEDVDKCFDIDKVEGVPYKDRWYINRRYFNHPYYEYKIYALKPKEGSVKAILITREVECMSDKVLRIIDYIGNQSLFSGLYNFFKGILARNNYEYIDFYNYGFEEQYILEAGFKLRTENDENIIPNYFEPFMQKNIDIWVHYSLGTTTFFKGDGDQDRPNEIRSY